MKASFTPQSVSCISPKAGSGTVYGPSDGLKIYFIAESSNGSVSRLESAGISPPLDTYYPMFSGDTLDLNGTAPVGRANWKSDEIVFDEASTVTVTAIGINIGQAYLAGGGGHHNDEFFLATEAFARIFEVTPIEVALPILRYAIERLNDFADCRGSVFAFKKTWRGTELLAELLRGRGTLEVAFQPGDSQLSGGSSQGCNVPSYSFRLRADAAPLPSVQTSDVITKEDYSEPVDFIPGLRSCADRVGPAKVWAAIMDRAFQFIPDPDLKQLRYQWYVEGRQIPMTGSGTLSFSKEVTREPNYVRSQTSVTVGYSVSVSGRLLLTTNGADGNYWLRVECWVVDAAGAVLGRIFSSEFAVVGMSQLGDHAWENYKLCVSQAIARLSEIHFVQPVIRGHGLPTDLVRKMEQKILATKKLLDRS